LVDNSVVPAVAINGETIHFGLGASTCDGVTDVNGKASCQLTPQSSGSSVLSAVFDGTASFAPAEEYLSFEAYLTFLGFEIFKDGFESP
jgi:hypothetical protein